MAGADGDTPAAVAQRTLEMAERFRDPSAMLQVFAASCEERISNAFRDETSPAGEKWPALADSTLKARAAKLPGARRRSKGGALTKGARAKREAGRTQPGAIKILVDTGSLRGGIAVRVVDGGTALEFTGPMYLRTHVQGDPDRNIPKRNPLPIEVVQGDAYLIPDADRELREMHARWTLTGETGARS